MLTKQQPSLWECGKPCSIRLSKLGGRRTRMRFQDRYPAHRAPFPQRIVEFPACFAVLFLVRGLGTEMWTSKKPRRMTTFTDSCSEPKKIRLSSSLVMKAFANTNQPRRNLRYLP